MLRVVILPLLLLNSASAISNEAPAGNAATAELQAKIRAVMEEATGAASNAAAREAIAMEGNDDGETDKDGNEITFEQALERAARTNAEVMPNIPDDGAIDDKVREDVRRLLDQVDQRRNEYANIEQLQGRPAPPIAYVFVSFSMPEETLRNLLAQANAAQVPLVLRGLVNDSVLDTRVRIARVMGAPMGNASEQLSEEINADQGGMMIDPTLFTRFDVQSVPAFVVPLEPLAPCDESGCPVPEFHKVSGDIPLAYALETVARHDEQLAERLAPAISVLQGRTSW